MKVGSVRHLNNTWRTVELPMEFYAGDLLSLISACPKEERGLVSMLQLTTSMNSIRLTSLLTTCRGIYLGSTLVPRSIGLDARSTEISAQ